MSLADPTLSLLFDGLMVRSPGLLCLFDELLDAAARTCPPGARIIAVPPEERAAHPLHPGVRCIHRRRPSMGWAGRWRWANLDLVRLAIEQRVSAAYCLSGIISAALNRRCGTVGTVNNMLPFTPERMEDYPLISREHLRLLLLKQVYLASLRRADAVVLHSGHALDRIASGYANLREKTLVVHTGIPRDAVIDPRSTPAHPNHGRPYLFFLSAIYPYKNHLRLLEAYSRALHSTDSMPELVLAGLPADTEQVTRVQRAITDLGLAQNARYLGSLPRGDLPAWYYHATGNVFPSTCETNSVVLAEILGAQGVLACSSSPPMPEIVADAALLFDPFDIDSIRAALIRLAHEPDLRSRLRDLASLRAQRLSWDACGEVIWQAAGRAVAALQQRRIR